MPIDPSIILAGSRPPQPIDPVEALGRVYQLQALKQQQQENQIKLQQYQALQAGQQRANQIIATLPRADDGTFDTGALLQRLAAANVPVDQQEALAKSVDGVNGVLRSAHDSRANHLGDLANVLLSSKRPDAPLSADTVHLGLATAQAAGLASDQDAAQVLQALGSGADPEQLLKMVRGAAPKYASEKPVVIPRGGTLANPTTGDVIAHGQAPAQTEAELAAAAGSDPNAAAALQRLQAPAMAARQTAQASLDERTRADRVNEAIAKQREAREASQDVGVSLTSQGLDIAAENFAKTGQLPPMGMGKQGAAVRSAIINRAAQLHPDLDLASARAGFAADEGSLKKLQAQRDAITSFENTAAKNIDIFLTTAGKIVDTGSPMANGLARAVSGKMLGSPDQAAYDAARQVAINEVAKITSNPNLSGALSDSARNEVSNFNPSTATLKQTVAVMRILKQDMANRASAMDQTLATVKGRISGKGASPATAPQEGTEGVVNGKPAVWKTVNGQTGWYAK